MLRKIMSIITVLTFVVMVTACSRPDPIQEVSKTVTESLALLEKGDFNTFVNKYIHPKDLDKIYKTMKPEQFKRAFAGGNYRKIMKILKRIKTDKPELSHGNRVASYTIPGTRRSLVLIRHKDHWYLTDTSKPSEYLK